MDLEERVKRASAGDREAFRELYEEFAEMVYRACWAAVLEKEAAKDLFQEVWLKVYLGLPSLREPRKFPAWLKTLVHRTILDHLRARERGETVPLAEEPNSGTKDSTTKLEARELLKLLSSRERYVFYLRYFEGLSVKEIAAQLGWSLSAVKMTLHRGKQKLRRILEGRNQI